MGEVYALSMPLAKQRVRKSTRSAKESDTYSDPLVYDIIHEPGTREEVGSLIRLAKRWLPKIGGTAESCVWLEPACGSGRCLRALARRNQRCVGVDISRAMVEYAIASIDSENQACVRVLEGDMRRMNAPSVVRAIRHCASGDRVSVAAFCPHNSVRHLTSDREMIAHLASIAKVLRRFGGVYFVGIGLASGEGQEGEGACETVFSASRRGVRVREIIDFVPPPAGSRGMFARREMAYKHVTVTLRGQEREAVSSYALRTYTLKQWQRVVRAGGMREIGVAGAFGEAFEPTRLHYAYRVLAPSS